MKKISLSRQVMIILALGILGLLALGLSAFALTTAPVAADSFTFSWGDWTITSANGKVTSMTHSSSYNAYDLYASWLCNTTYCQGDNGSGSVYIPLTIGGADGLTNVTVVVRTEWWPDQGGGAPQANWGTTFLSDNVIGFHTNLGSPSGSATNWVYTSTIQFVDVPSISLLALPGNWRGVVTNPNKTYAVHGRVTIVSINGEGVFPPTATPIPTATAFIVLQSLCITGTAAITPTVQPTPTPYGLTTTPLAISPTPGPTGTPQPVAANLNYTSTADFATGLQPWTAGMDWAGEVGLHTLWRDDLIGSDTITGVAQIGMGNNYDSYSGWSGSAGWEGIHDPIINYTGMSTEMLIFPLPQLIDRAINITGQVRSLNPVEHSGNHIWLMFWYLDPGIGITDTSPEQTWILKPAYLTEVSYTWGQFAQRIIPDEDLLGDRAHQAAAIALTWYMTADAPENRGPDMLSNAVLVDDINISIGDLADAALPRCPGAGLGPNAGRGSKICPIAAQTVDVLNVCTPPTDFIDIGGWIGWIWCRVRAYFTWVNQNRDQIVAMQSSQNDVEPFGSMVDLVSVSAIVAGKLDALQSQNKSNGVAPYDFANMMDTSALGRPIHLTVVTSTSYAYIAQCPADLITQNNDVLHGACMSVYFLRATPAVQIVQWGLNGFFVLAMIFVVIKILQTLAAH